MPNKNTLFVGKVSHRFPVLASTNEYAAECLHSGHPAEGTAIVADHQTAGRGQMGNSWESAAGRNLTLSVILYPRFLPAGRQFDLNQAVALAVRETVAQYTEQVVTIKWPNDILLGKRKICGILIQNSISGKNLQSSIAGIGINVNQDAFPAGLPNASSLYLETGRQTDLEELMQQLFFNLESWYLRLRQDRQAEIRTAYLAHLFQKGEEHVYIYPSGKAFSGKIIDVDASGRLVIETEHGMETFGMKEINYVWASG